MSTAHDIYYYKGIHDTISLTNCLVSRNHPGRSLYQSFIQDICEDIRKKYHNEIFNNVIANALVSLYPVDCSFSNALANYIVIIIKYMYQHHVRSMSIVVNT
jgi:hypothetical protein